MRMQNVDWAVVLFSLGLTLTVGVAWARRAASNVQQFFLSGRDMPWWLLGTSMVATTFSTDVPNLVTEIVRVQGVAGNWIWWAFLLTGMVTTFLYARLWRRSGVDTDIGFYELRYSGRLAAFLRGFRALYLGGLFNVMIMASGTLAMIKIGGVLLGASPIVIVLITGTATVLYSMLGGLTAVLTTDLLLFAMAMAGSLTAAYFALDHPEVGGLTGLITHPEVQGRLALVPSFADPASTVSLLVIPLAVQWWSVWYPGAEPGGGGYVAQRMLAARDEAHAQGATLLFNVAHYALRPWPWIVVGLSSLLVFPNLAALQSAFPGVSEDVIGHDMAYAAMLTFLPPGLLGLVVASLIAAYMSTISTHLNWGASYLVHDVFKRFIDPGASEHRLVLIARLSTVALMIVAGLISLQLSNALQAFHILLHFGAGTGLLFLLRWFWWKINAASELAAMLVSFFIAFYFQFLHEPLFDGHLADWKRLIIGVTVTTAVWLSVAYFTPATEETVLGRFYRTIRPAGPGWAAVRRRAAADGDPLPAESSDLLLNIACMILGTIAVYSALFATGLFIYGNTRPATALVMAGVIATIGIHRFGILRKSDQRNNLSRVDPESQDSPGRQAPPSKNERRHP